MKPTLILCLDACRHDYINPKDMPFLYGITKKSVWVQKQKCEPGYDEFYPAFTGTTKGGVLGEFRFLEEGERSPFWMFKYFPFACTHSRYKWLRYAITFLLRKFTQHKHVNIHWIPLNMLHRYGVCETTGEGIIAGKRKWELNIKNNSQSLQ